MSKTEANPLSSFITPELLETKMRSDNLRTWLELEALKEGTENQRERYAAGFLPEDELTHLARAILFKGFGEFRRWAGRDRTAIGLGLKHVPVAAQSGERPEVVRDEIIREVGMMAAARTPEMQARYDAACGKVAGPCPAVGRPDFEIETAEVDVLTAAEWDTLRKLQDMARAAEVHPWLVRSGGTVKVEPATTWATCKVCKSEACRSHAKVSIEWAGRTLVREYVLG